VTGSGRLLPMLETTVSAQAWAPSLAPSLAQGAEHHELPADPLVFGVGAFVLLLAMLAAVLMFGKGRPHS
jgi:hypothetical protein